MALHLTNILSADTLDSMIPGNSEKTTSNNRSLEVQSNSIVVKKTSADRLTLPVMTIVVTAKTCIKR